MKKTFREAKRPETAIALRAYTSGCALCWDVWLALLSRVSPVYLSCVKIGKNKDKGHKCKGWLL